MARPGSSSLVGDPALATLAGRDDDDDDDDDDGDDDGDYDDDVRARVLVTLAGWMIHIMDVYHCEWPL